ncbi:unnamed protein product [Arctogadus glacialis]
MRISKMCAHVHACAPISFWRMLYADGKGLIVAADSPDATRQRRRDLLLHLAGPDVQDIFSTLPDTVSSIMAQCWIPSDCTAGCLSHSDAGLDPPADGAIATRTPLEAPSFLKCLCFQTYMSRMMAGPRCCFHSHHIRTGSVPLMWFLSRKIGGADFQKYRSLLTSTHVPLQGTSKNIAGKDVASCVKAGLKSALYKWTIIVIMIYYINDVNVSSMERSWW